MRGVVESFGVLKGLPVADWRVVTSEKDLSAFGFPCFLKIDSGEHKSDVGGVLKCSNIDEAKDNLLKIHKAFPKNRIVVQGAVDGIEMIVGVKEDVVFGKLLVVGFGGIFAEVNRDVSFRALPVSKKDVVSMVRELRGFDVFSARGKKHDLEKFYDLVLKVGLVAEKKGISEMDLNPVIVGEKKSWIVDARVR